MKVLCLSASNSRKNKNDSVSSKVCKLIEAQITKEHEMDGIGLESLSLKDYDLQVCRLCGDCFQTGKCPYDEAFNQLLYKLEEADRIFFIIPHYAPLPAKLMILMEKINEIYYGGWINDSAYVSPVQGKIAGIIGHGGMTETEEVVTYYHESLVKPVAKALKSIGFEIRDLENRHGVVFGLLNDESLVQTETDLFPEIILDEERIAKRIEAYVRVVMGE